MRKLIVVIVLLVSVQVFGQDRIVRKNKMVIECKIREITSDEIKYLQPQVSKDVIFSIEKTDVDFIEFENGNIMKIENPMYDTSFYEHNKRNALKVSFFEPFMGSTGFWYEHLIKPGRTFEAGIGIIGLGFDTDQRKARGAYISGGYKFSRTPDYYLPRLRYAHLLKGSYIKPEVAAGFYSSNEPGPGTTLQKSNTLTLGLLVNFGKQWVFDDAFLLDLYWGFGYGLTNTDEARHHFSFSGGQKEAPIAFNFGLKIGLLTGTNNK